MRYFLIVLVGGAVLLGGCAKRVAEAGADTAQAGGEVAQPAATAMPRATPAPASDLQVGYTLLHGLAGQLRRVDQIFILKSVPEEVQAAVRPVAEIFGRLQRTLKQWSDADGAVRFVAAPLPDIEKGVRDAIEKTRSGELLGASGEEFSRRLLASQDEALTYAIHLTEELRKREKSVTRSEALVGFLSEMRSAQAGIVRLAHGGG